MLVTITSNYRRYHSRNQDSGESSSSSCGASRIEVLWFIQKKGFRPTAHSSCSKAQTAQPLLLTEPDGAHVSLFRYCHCFEVIIALAGALSIYYGYRLFYIAKEKQGQLRIQTGKDQSLSMIDLAPGIFFALFGAGILVASLFFPMHYSDRVHKGPENVSEISAGGIHVAPGTRR